VHELIRAKHLELDRVRPASRRDRDEFECPLHRSVMVHADFRDDEGGMPGPTVRLPIWMMLMRRSFLT
jgi:hypothetical protein